MIMVFMYTNEPRECLRCGHSWVPRKDKRPVACPRCKSYTWDVPSSEGYSLNAMIGKNQSSMPKAVK
jgi:Zn finger protein HypA/HybF involved in hydrogenase expression